MSCRDTIPALLARWRSGDREALTALIERELSWIRSLARRRLGRLLRGKAETDDFVQDLLVRVLATKPGPDLLDEDGFRALLATILENVLRDQHDRFTAAKRAAGRERRLLSASAGQPPAEVARPSEMAQLREWEDWIHRGMEQLAPEDRDLLRFRQWMGLSHSEIGGRMGISEDAARMRFARALARLAGEVQKLKAGREPRP
jgi:RNA polymerase sigma-70 factor, ECF subfamily